jgi:hypothetical protein
VAGFGTIALAVLDAAHASDGRVVELDATSGDGAPRPDRRPSQLRPWSDPTT